MARKPRFNIPDIPQHVIQRGNNRDPCFYSSQDSRFYLDVLQAASEKSRCVIHAYVLMTNHAHLLVTAEAGGGISAMMQSLGRRYVRYIKDVYQRTGTLWEGRYKACIVESGRYLLTCYRYIELNPLGAGLLEAPGRYPWTSCRHNALGYPDALVTGHEINQALGESAEGRCRAYRALFVHSLVEDEMQAIRTTPMKNWFSDRNDSGTGSSRCAGDVHGAARQATGH